MTAIWNALGMDDRPDASRFVREATWFAGETRRLGRDAVAGLVDPRTWRALGWMLLTLTTRLILLTVTVALIVPSLALCLVGIGIPLTVEAHWVVRGEVGLERKLVAMVGSPVPGRPRSTGSLLSRFSNRDRWREVVFALTAWLLTAIGLTVALLGWGVPLYLLSVPLWGWAVESLSWPESIAMAVAGALLLLAAPVPTRWVAEALVRHTEVSVGPDRLAQMAEQVREVSENRAEILEAVRSERKRIERNLHDGVQQRLVALGIDLGIARTKVDEDPAEAIRLLDEAVSKTQTSIAELRTIGRGLQPAVLGDRGLDAALSSVVAMSAVPVRLECDLEIEPPAEIAETAYFAVSEAITNIMKHSRARTASVSVLGDRTALRVEVHDDGEGGATDSPTGHGPGGLNGTAARIRATGGTFAVTSPRGGPTTVTAMLPYPVEP